jgi:hypothetical protein
VRQDFDLKAIFDFLGELVHGWYRDNLPAIGRTAQRAPNQMETPNGNA